MGEGFFELYSSRQYLGVCLFAPTLGLLVFSLHNKTLVGVSLLFSLLLKNQQSVQLLIIKVEVYCHREPLPVKMRDFILPPLCFSRGGIL